MNASESLPGATGVGAGLAPALEAVLLVADTPLAVSLLAQVLDHPVDVVEATLVDLAAQYDRDGRGFELRKLAGGWRFTTRALYDEVVETFVLEGQQARLSRAALETLAVVAYQQPISRARVSAIRGVNVDGVMRTLLTRGLVAEAGREETSGAHLYATTGYFLERIGIDTLDELPALAPYLPELDDLEEELLTAPGATQGADSTRTVEMTARSDEPVAEELE